MNFYKLLTNSPYTPRASAAFIRRDTIAHAATVAALSRKARRGRLFSEEAITHVGLLTVSILARRVVFIGVYMTYGPSFWSRLVSLWKPGVCGMVSALAEKIIRDCTCGVFVASVKTRFNFEKAWGLPPGLPPESKRRSVELPVEQLRVLEPQ